MKEEIYSKKSLTDYLLGKLSETDADLFDEMSIADDEFVDALKVVEDELIDSYLRGELDNADVGRFEASYLATSLRREKVEFARALQTVIAGNESTRVTPVEIEAQAVSSVTLWQRLLALGPAFRYGFAAVAALALVSVVLILFRASNSPTEIVVATPTPLKTPLPEPSRETKPSESPLPTPTLTPTPERKKELLQVNKPSLATFILAPPVRSSPSLPTFNVPANAVEVMFVLQLESDDFSDYAVALKSQTGSVLRRINGIKAKNEALSFRIPANLIKPNIYTLTVSGVSGSGEAEIIGDYPFRSVLK